MDQITPVIDFQHELGDLFDVTGKVAYLPGGYGGIGAAASAGRKPSAWRPTLRLRNRPSSA